MLGVQIAGVAAEALNVEAWVGEALAVEDAHTVEHRKMVASLAAQAEVRIAPLWLAKQARWRCEHQAHYTLPQTSVP